MQKTRKAVRAIRDGAEGAPDEFDLDQLMLKLDISGVKGLSTSALGSFQGGIWCDFESCSGERRLISKTDERKREKERITKTATPT